MRKITPVTFSFAYLNEPSSEAMVKNTYRRIFAIAKRNLIQKGLINNVMYKDIESKEKVIIDNNNVLPYIEDHGRISDSRRGSSKAEIGQSYSVSDGQAWPNSSSESGDSLADQQ